MYVIEQPLLAALAADSAANVLAEWNTIYDAYNENYNMHNMRKTIGELHAMLIEHEKGLSKKAATPQEKGKGKYKLVYIPKPKNSKPSAKEHPTKDDACHHCKEVGHWKRNFPIYLVELTKKNNQVGTSNSSARKMTRKSFPHRPERATNLLGIIHTDVCGPLRHVSRQDASYFITFTDDYSHYGFVYLLTYKHEDTWGSVWE
nr:zinc finger, CCHC-type [Tanacetum cinerariifolium]